MSRTFYVLACVFIVSSWGCARDESPGAAASSPEVAAREGTTGAVVEAEAPCPHHAAAPAGEAFSTTSVFHLEHPFVDTTGATRHLRELRGHPAVVVMFYAGCTTACPILFSDGERLEGLLEEDVRSEVRFVYVTIDPAHDTPEVLGAYAARRGLDLERWSLWQGSEEHTRALAAVLGVQYRADGEGNFSHTSRLALLDAEGNIVGSVDGLKQPMEEAAAKLTSLVRSR